MPFPPAPRPTWPVGLLALLAACIDYQPVGKEDAPGLDDEETAGPDTEETEPDSGEHTDAPVEECNGLDDDGDAEVDEGFFDVDADGLADCVDDDCIVDHDGAQIVEDPHACDPVLAPAVDPWNLELVWEYYRTEDNCTSTVVADLDADGVAEIVCIGVNRDELTVLSGLDGRLLFESELIGQGSGLTIADLDGGGDLEIAGFSPDGELVALHADGSLLWRSAAPYGPFPIVDCTWISMLLDVADLAADGIPEVIGHHGIVRGWDGATGPALDPNADVTSLQERDLSVADIDNDGVTDIVSRWRRYTADGVLVWEYAPSATWRYFSDPVMVQADTDADAELLWVSEFENVLMEPDGGTIWSQTLRGDDEAWSLACAGDLDGDGWMEVVYHNIDEIVARSVDGTQLWSAPRTDFTDWYVACTAFDFDLDGADEVVTVDDETFRVMDGATGTTLFMDESWHSATVGDKQLVVDLDGDGSVEILLENPWAVGAGAQATYKVYRNVNRDWPPGTQIWPSATWSGTSVLPDGRVPRTADKPWLTTLKWRGQPEWVATGFDLRAVVGDACVASCDDDGLVRLALRIEDLGPEEVDTVPLAVYGIQGDGSRALLTVLTYSWIDNSTASEDQDFETTTAQARRGLVLVAGDDGTGAISTTECNAADNETTWALTECG